MTENKEVSALWARALKALETAELLVESDTDTACSRAFYAAFYAVSALFLVEGKSYKRHTAVEVAVHRDLVKTGRWDESLGHGYSSLRNLRAVGDYGGSQHPSTEQTDNSVKMASRILTAVHEKYPDIFTDPSTG